jgi:hypothetical protein
MWITFLEIFMKRVLQAYENLIISVFQNDEMRAKARFSPRTLLGGFYLKALLVKICTS